jgi:uncharacterized integral membrane protein (TIGR00698 family)
VRAGIRTSGVTVVFGVAAAALGLGVAFLIHLLIPAVPMLTACVVIGVIAGQIPAVQRAIDGRLKPGLALSSRRLLRIGIVLLGLQLSLASVAALGWQRLVIIVVIVAISFVGTFFIAKFARLPGDEPLLLAAGFAICGVSAIGAMGAVTGAKTKDMATPVALVTLFGTAAIAVLPLLSGVLGLSAQEFGDWTGSSVHDVGQVVATAQTAGAAALAVAVVVKLTRVVLLAPITLGASLILRARPTSAGAARPPLVPLFVLGFVAAILIGSFVPVPDVALQVAATIQTVLLGLALVALGSSIRLVALASTGLRALGVGLISWALIAGVALAAFTVVV